MTLALQAVAVVFLVIGGAFGLLGSYGMIRLRDPMQRLHAPSKASTVGVGAVLIGGFLLALAQQQVAAHYLLVTVFLLITAPVSALFLARAHLFHTVPRSDLPPTGTGTDWTTHDLPD